MIINAVQTRHLPAAVKAVTVPNDDDTWTILLNSRYSVGSMQRSMVHEVQHIMRGDFFTSSITATQIETDVRTQDSDLICLEDLDIHYSVDEN